MLSRIGGIYLRMENQVEKKMEHQTENGTTLEIPDWVTIEKP